MDWPHFLNPFLFAFFSGFTWSSAITQLREHFHFCIHLFFTLGSDFGKARMLRIEGVMDRGAFWIGPPFWGQLWFLDLMG